MKKKIIAIVLIIIAIIGIAVYNVQKNIKEKGKDYTLEENKNKNALFGGINNLKFKKQVVPGDRLKLEVKIIKQKGPVGIGEAIATVDGKVAVKGELTFVIVNNK